MKKKYLSTLLAAAMTFSVFAGCETSVIAAEGEMTAAEQAIAERKESGEIPTVVIATLTWTGRPTGADRVQDALNAYLEESIGVNVELEIMDFSSYSQEMTLMLAGGEQVDIFNAIAMGYTNAVSKGYALELDELLEDYGQGILENIDSEFIEAARIDGTIYGLPQKRDIASGKGRIVVPVRCLDEIGYDWASNISDDGESVEVTWDDVDAIFAQLHEAYPDATVIYPNKGTALANSLLYDPVGNDNYGVLMDFENSLEVTNLFETDEFLEVCQRFYKWNQAGYIYQDVLTDSATPQSFIREGRALTTLANWKPGGKLEQESQIGEEIVYLKVLGEFISSSAATSMNWCINQACEDPVATMQVLNALYSDPTAATLFGIGEEGVDYVVADDGYLDYPEGVDSTTVTYSSLEWLNPNQNLTGVRRGAPLDVHELTDEFNKSASKSIAMGFAFDNSEVVNEYTALTNAYSEYIYQILLGFVEPEAAIAEMNEKLYSAGLEKYMAAKQEALNTWAEEKGIQ